MISQAVLFSYIISSTAFQTVLGPHGHGRRRDVVLNLNPSPRTSDPAARFHTDMHRILESRRNLASSTPLVLSPLERRKRPEVLTTDIDGAERVVGMLRHMELIGVATDESYQIALGALVQRGRLRWRRDDSLIVCAADMVGEILNGA